MADILIAGAGEVGRNLIPVLLERRYRIHVIDTDQHALDTLPVHAQITKQCSDIISSALFLNTAAHKYQVYLAITSSDETNIISCTMARDAGIGKTVCRLHGNTPQSRIKRSALRDLGIDHVINPSRIVAQEIYRLIHAPNSVESHQFFDGASFLLGIRLNQNASVLGKPFPTIVQELRQIAIQAAYLRQEEALSLDTPDIVAQQGDFLYFFCDPNSLHRVRTYLGYTKRKVPRSIIINGGGNVGLSIALLLASSKHRVKILEKNAQRCRTLSALLSNALVLNCDGSREEVLQTEKVEKTDFFVSVTDDLRTNVTSCMLAAKYGVPYTLCLSQNPEYLAVIEQNSPIFSAVNPRRLSANHFLRYIHLEAALTYVGLLHSQWEFMEFAIPAGTADIPMEDIHKFSRPYLVLRAGCVFPADEEHCLRGGDRVILGIHSSDKQAASHFSQGLVPHDQNGR